MADETAFTNADKLTQEQAIEDYGKLVYFMAHKFKRCGLPFEDIVQEGTLGLLQAVDKFNPSLKVPFSAFAASYIKFKMLKAISNHSKTIRVPITTWRNLARIRNAREHLVEQLGREPTDQEIADYLHIPIEAVRKGRAGEVVMLSINAPRGEDDAGDYTETIPDDTPMPGKLLSDMDTYERLGMLVDALPARQRMIIQRRYGLNSGSPEGLQEIGLSMDCCSENVRVLEVKALGRLRGMMRDEVGAVR